MQPLIKRTILYVLQLVFLPALILAQASNNSCSGAIDLTPSVPCTSAAGDLQDAVHTAPTGACGGATATTTKAVWYKFTATSPSVVISLNTLGSNLTTATTYIELLNGSCGSFTSLVCQDATTALTYSSLTVGTLYYVRVYITGTTTGNPSNRRGFNICLVSPANDECTGASTLTSSTTCTNVSGTLNYATISTGLPAGCQSAGNLYDIWYKFVATNTSHTLTLSGQGSSFTNPEIQLFSGTCAGLSSLTCGTTTLTNSSLTIGNTYYVRVSNIGSGMSSNGDFNICLTHPTPPPSNDDCAGAITLSNGVTNSSGTVMSATTTTGVPVDCATGDPDDDVWYKFTPGNTNLNISLTSIGTNLSTSGIRVQLFSGTCGTLSSVACGTTGISTSGLTTGATYYIRVYSAGTGSIGGTAAGSVFSITATSSMAPGNDDCSTAYLLPVSGSCYNAKGTLTGATASTGIPIGSCTGTPDDDVWYEFIASKTNPTITLSSLAASITGTGTGSRLQLFAGSCGSLTSIACGTTSISGLSLTVGDTYYIRVYSNAAIALTAATFNICITNPSPSLTSDSTTTLFNIDTVAKRLGYPWEVTYGPDDSLWITEARGYRVLRVSSSRTETQKNVNPQQVLKIPLGSSEVSFNRSVGTWPQGGMQGLAIHPEFMTDPAKRWVYVAYVYSGTCASGSGVPCYFRTKIIRCQFYFSTDAGNPTSIPKRDTLVILDTLISNLPGSNDHNSGRMKIGPVVEGSGPATYKLYYTIGDMGAGQFNNSTRVNYAQVKDTCEGKILRLNTEPDGDGVPGSPTHDFDKWRQWIPNDNPFNHTIITGLKTPVYTIGHRNAQGLAWGNVNGTWRLFSSEHGDKSDDEVNIIESGKNYGWPKVAGLDDDNYNTGDNSTDGFAANDILAGLSVTNEQTLNADLSYKNPTFSFFNWNAPMLENITGNLFTWPTIAPSGIDFYGSSQIPGWKNSLLVTSLKYGIFRLKLNSTGTLIDSSVSLNAVDTFPLLHGWRVRDIAISSNGGYIWAVIDSSGSTSGPTGGFGGSSSATKDGGKMLRLTYKFLTTLPTNILTFQGKLLPDATVRLEWIAFPDADHDYFQLEKADVDGNFVALARVTGPPPYYHIDPTPNIGNNFYRIKQVDRDGRFHYSKVVNVVYNAGLFTSVTYANPVKDELALNFKTIVGNKVSIELYTLDGKRLINQDAQLNPGTSMIRIDVSGIASQVTLMRIIDESGNIIATDKLIKL
jgi:PQQ-dependent dehydrogenase (s-GDH family)